MRRTLALSAALVLVASAASAHAVLKKSTLPNEIAAGSPRSVTLSFNSAVEPGLSRVVLVDAGKSQREIALHAGAAPTEIALELPGLAAGAWGLRYKVLAVDGHVTENLLRFTVTSGN